MNCQIGDAVGNGQFGERQDDENHAGGTCRAGQEQRDDQRSQPRRHASG